jgi:hypothetical protein
MALGQPPNIPSWLKKARPQADIGSSPRDPPSLPKQGQSQQDKRFLGADLFGAGPGQHALAMSSKRALAAEVTPAPSNARDREPAQEITPVSARSSQTHSTFSDSKQGMLGEPAFEDDCKDKQTVYSSTEIIHHVPSSSPRSRGGRERGARSSTSRGKELVALARWSKTNSSTTEVV